ncbi:hypothetical protein KAOT1_15222 [Kordia algicida OT-1]|uniref:Uncharacterized protein n=2 Tax=Kordia TaxID=221065 RepID=A9DLJ5_9FLAO|nr:hypothetical protein [Kordia algicida]EDP98580.1 hypothetical protein KAOT1_15222 [Kordia algicida OT-1]
MIKKFDIKLIILECVALIFIISGIKRLYFAYNGTIFNALTEEDWKMYEALTDMYASQFLDNQSYWILAAMLIGILVIGLINWKNNFGIINSIAVLILTVGIAMTGFYTTGIVNKY